MTQILRIPSLGLSLNGLGHAATSLLKTLEVDFPFSLVERDVVTEVAIGVLTELCEVGVAFIGVTTAAVFLEIESVTEVLWTREQVVWAEGALWIFTLSWLVDWLSFELGPFANTMLCEVASVVIEHCFCEQLAFSWTSFVGAQSRVH